MKDTNFDGLSPLIHTYNIIRLPKGLDTFEMFQYKVVELICSLVAILNIVTGLILYREEQKLGITLGSASRRRAILACTLMCLVFGGTALILMGIDLKRGPPVGDP